MHRELLPKWIKAPILNKLLANQMFFKLIAYTMFGIFTASVVLPVMSQESDRLIDSVLRLKELGAENVFTIDGKLSYVNMKGTDFSDKHCELLTLPQANAIVFLSLQDTQITDKSLVAVGSFKDLKWLIAGGNNITDEGIQSLKGLSKLKTLSISRTAVTDSSFDFKNDDVWPQLTTLNLSDTMVSGKIVEPLMKLSRLSQLNLSGTGIDDTGLEKLSSNRQLVRLVLNRTKVTDVGLMKLAKMKQLKSLSVIGTEVTAEGAKNLKTALPDCMITVTPEKPQPSDGVANPKGVRPIRWNHHLCRVPSP